MVCENGESLKTNLMEAYEIYIIHILKTTLAAFAENCYGMLRHKILFEQFIKGLLRQEATYIRQLNNSDVLTPTITLSRIKIMKSNFRHYYNGQNDEF
jgi:hypothetical protein